ncbi:hypothetical protein BDZ91DRAFT_734042 [Kalaharituber pfeilii]|nr:hypothetical protein BDZ91DRAFT_734042 [Kalaharituber pfeilii]
MRQLNGSAGSNATASAASSSSSSISNASSNSNAPSSSHARAAAADTSFADTSILGPARAADETTQHSSSSYAMDHPPVRPRNSKMEMGFLSKKRETSPTNSTSNANGTYTSSASRQTAPSFSSLSSSAPPIRPSSSSSNRILSHNPSLPPLMEADTSILNIRTRSRPSTIFESSAENTTPLMDDSNSNSKPWKHPQSHPLPPHNAKRRVSSGSVAGVQRMTAAAARRRSIIHGHHNSHHGHHSSPETKSSTSVTFKAGHARRMSKVGVVPPLGRENSGGGAIGHGHGGASGGGILSPPKSTLFKSSARRVTISGRGELGLRVSGAAVLARMQGVVAVGGAGSKPMPWR